MKVVDFLIKDVLNHNLSILNEPLKWLFERFDVHYGMIDRTNTFSMPWCKNLYDIPTGKSTLSFNDTCVKRAHDLINENKLITLFWSGGVDSTTALCSLIESNIRKDQLIIFYNDLSIVEYPKAYVEVVKKYNNKKINNYFDNVLDDSLIVTGECGDQVFGSQFIPSENKLINGKVVTIKGATRRPFEFSKTIDELDLLDRAPNEFHDFIKKAPFKLKTKYDLFWWVDFVFRWQHMNLRICINSNEDSYVNFLKNSRAFFNSYEFQLWSMNEYNHREVKQTHSNIIKKPAKDFIKYVFPDDAYYYQKPKIGSLPSAYRVNLLGRFEDGFRATTESQFSKKLNESN